MSTSTFAQKIKTARRRLAVLEQRVRAASEPSLPPELPLEALAELAAALDELQATGEELDHQNERLAVAHQRYQELFNLAPDGYLVTTVHGVIQEANQAAANLLQKRQDFLVRKPLAIFVPLEERPAFRDWLTQLGQSPGPEAQSQRRELRLQPQGSKPFFAALTVAPAYNAQGKLVSLRWLLQDITARKQAEEALRRSEARLEGIISTASDAIITIDAHQRLILFNPTAEQVFRYKADEVIGQPLNLLIPDRFREAHTQHVHQFGRTGITARRMGLMPGELWGRRADGEEFPLEAMISQVEVSGEKFYTVILRDITERQRIEAVKAHLFDEVSQQRERLRALTRQLGQVQEAERKQLAQELHDQVGRTLTALGLNLHAIRSQLDITAPEAGLILRRLDDSLALVEETTERVRDVMAQLRPPVLDDYGLVAALRWYGVRFAEWSGLPVLVEGEEPAPRLAAPVENALFRIVQEALINVVKHAQATQVRVIVETDNSLIRLIVADDGSGFEPARLTSPSGRQGWGMLTMTERAEAVGGHCRIESQPGQGARVIIEVAR